MEDCGRPVLSEICSGWEPGVCGQRLRFVGGKQVQGVEGWPRSQGKVERVWTESTALPCSFIFSMGVKDFLLLS